MTQEGLTPAYRVYRGLNQDSISERQSEIDDSAGGNPSPQTVERCREFLRSQFCSYQEVSYERYFEKKP